MQEKDKKQNSKGECPEASKPREVEHFWKRNNVTFQKTDEKNNCSESGREHLN